MKKGPIKESSSLRFASVHEAKAILKNIYKKRGFRVIRITKKGYHFMVSFGEGTDKKGKGPGGLKTVLCNWPRIEK